MQTYSTAHLPYKAKLAYWNDVNRILMTPFAVRADGPDFEAEVRVEALGPVWIAEVRSLPADVAWARDRATQAKGHSFSLHMRTHGKTELSHYGRNSVLSDGDFVLCDNLSPMHFSILDPGRAVVVDMPDEVLKAHIPNPELFCGKHMSGRHGFGLTVSSMLESIWRQAEEGFTPGASALIIRHFLDVLATSFAMLGDDPGQATAGDTIRRARIVRFIEAHLRDPDLTPGAVAKEFKISPRYLRMIFSANGETVSGFVLRRRLEECAREMASNLWQARTITEIAFRWGFNSAPYFTRAFREHYGVTPSDYRHNRVRA